MKEMEEKKKKLEQYVKKEWSELIAILFSNMGKCYFAVAKNSDE